jgi:SPOR domain
MFSKTPPRRGSPPEVPPARHRHGGAGPARRPADTVAGRKPAREPVLAEAVVALVTGSALLLAMATAVVMVTDGRSGPSTVPPPVLAEAPAPPPAAPPVAPPAVEPRFPADQQEQPLAEVAPKTQREEKPFPAPVAPSDDLLGPAPADMRFAVYLASFSSEEQAHAGWEILERRYRRPLSGLGPLVRRGKSKQGDAVFQLFAGPFDSLLDATRRCAALATATANCKPADLSQAGEETGSWD